MAFWTLVTRLSQRFCSEIDSTVLAMAAGSVSTSAPAITADIARNLLTNLLRHRRADLGTCQVEPHWAQVSYIPAAAPGTACKRSSPHDGARVGHWPSASRGTDCLVPGPGATSLA
jgi:hypothetical protein